MNESIITCMELQAKFDPRYHTVNFMYFLMMMMVTLVLFLFV